MALLVALVALGGIDVPEDRLIDILWTKSLEGDEQKALDVTVHRLRKLLGQDDALKITDRRVSFNREIVWVDLWALERLLAGATTAAPTSSFIRRRRRDETGCVPEPVLESSRPATI